MNSLQLKIPVQDLLDAQSLDPNPRALDMWLAGLQRANVEDSAQRLFDLLRKYNRCQIEPALRYQAMASLAPVLRDLIEALKGKYLCNVYALTEKQWRGAGTIRHVLEEMAFAYKIIINDSVGEDKNYELPPRVLLDTIYNALVHLSELMLSAYYFYAPEPKGIWGELHRLYYFAEYLGAHAQTLVRDDSRSSISHPYKKVVLLAMANPYQLMPGEVIELYRHLERWVAHCSIMPAASDVPLHGRFVLNLSGETGPEFITKATTPLSGSSRVVAVDGLLESLEQEMRTISAGEQKPASLTMKERMQRNMLLRLKRVWSGRMVRKNERRPQRTRMLLTAGLSATHYFVSTGEPFDPEREEVRYYRPDLFKRDESGLMLMPREFEPWKTDELEARIVANFSQSRISHFDKGDPALDMWEKIYATEARARALYESREPDYTAQLWWQTNESSGGIGLRREDAGGIRVHVGDVVGFKRGIAEDEDWQIGTIRWLRNKGEETLEVGIKTLAHNAHAVAVRAIGGVGKGGEYFRCLVAIQEQEAGNLSTLIVPANIFDLGTRLVLNMKRKILYVCLVQLLEATTSFAQFGYKTIEMPDSEKRNIEALCAA